MQELGFYLCLLQGCLMQKTPRLDLFSRKLEFVTGTIRHATCKENASRIEISLNMNTLTVKGTWKIVKGKLKQKFAQLVDDDLQFSEGKAEELIGRIQKRAEQSEYTSQRTAGCTSKHC